MVNVSKAGGPLVSGVVPVLVGVVLSSSLLQLADAASEYVPAPAGILVNSSFLAAIMTLLAMPGLVVIVFKVGDTRRRRLQPCDWYRFGAWFFTSVLDCFGWLGVGNNFERSEPCTLSAFLLHRWLMGLFVASGLACQNLYSLDRLV